jgi:hypothetical protein
MGKNIVARQSPNGLRHLTADDMKLCFGQLLPNQGHDLVHEPKHGVHVRRVFEAADEEEIAAILEWRYGRPGLMDIRNDFDPLPRQLFRQDFLFIRAHDQDGVAFRRELQFHELRFAGYFLDSFVPG